MNGRGDRFDRRRFLLGAAAGVAGAGLAAADPGAAAVHRRARDRRRDRSTTTVLASGVTVPTAGWLIAENARPGTIDWVVTGTQAPHAIEGFASRVSAAVGDEVVLFVNTVARSVRVQAYRMGYYQGLGGRLVAQSDEVAGQVQPPRAWSPGSTSSRARGAPPCR